VDIADPDTGELLERRPVPTRTMSVEAFSDFAERARLLLWERFAIVTQDPDPDYAAKRPDTAAKGATLRLAAS
jgi:hypothetical protein